MRFQSKNECLSLNLFAGIHTTEDVISHFILAFFVLAAAISLVFPADVLANKMPDLKGISVLEQKIANKWRTVKYFSGRENE